ncbi:hypothetical protein EBB07_02495 [Paenibacillaceae bacterium]|nr:hypothetical protein EBB07_02495 [Paenibacillaceae bacterium]
MKKKMKLSKVVSVVTASMLLLSAAPAFAQETAQGTAQATTQAATSTKAERAYEVNYKVLKDGTEEVSEADKYIAKPAKVTVEDGIGYVELTLLKSSWFTSFEIEQDGKRIKPETVSSDAKEDTKTVKFAIKDLREKLTAHMAVEVASMNYKHTYTVQLQFDTTGMPGAPSKENSGEAEEAEHGKEYEVAYKVLKDGTDESSSMSDFTSKTAKLNAREGAYYLSFTVSSSSMIPSLQYEKDGKFTDVVVLSEDKEADTRTIEIPVADVASKINVAMEVNAGPRGIMKHTVQIQIDTTGMPGAPTKEEETEEPTIEVTLTDIEGHWAKASIEEAVARGLVNGYNNGTFNPNGEISRAEFAAILAKALKLDAEIKEEAAFTDAVAIPAWATSAVEQVNAAGLLTGYQDGSFRAAGKINRAELAVIIARAAKLELFEDSKLTFADASDVPAWAQSGVAATVEAGYIGGRDGNKFAPLAQATRAEAAVLVLKLLQAAK